MIIKNCIFFTQGEVKFLGNSKFIKQRTGVLNNNYLYIQDKELNSTKFADNKEGYFKYIIQEGLLTILPTNQAKEPNAYKISKRQLKSFSKPVLDIRNTRNCKPLDAFKGYTSLEITIYEDKVLVEGFKEKSQSFVQKAVFSIKKPVNKVTDITDLITVNKQFEVLLSKSELLKVSNGNIEQLSLNLDELFYSNKTINITKNSSLPLSKNNLKIPLIVDELFGGAGMLGAAFLKYFKIAVAIEKDRDACKTYRQNINTHVLNEDICKIDKTVIQSPIIIGGPPCQGFSNNNRVTNYLDNSKNLLMLEYIKCVQQNKNCKVFLIENVPQMLTCGNGQFRKEIFEKLNDFEISYGILNSADFGTPQIRKRAIVIGSKIGKITLPKPLFNKNNYRTVWDAFRDFKSDLANALDVTVPSEETKLKMSYIPQDGNVLDIPIEIRPNSVHSNVYKRLSWFKPSITIANFRKANIMPPEGNQILSVRQAARLQGMPDEFVFLGNLSSKQQQVSNGVPFELGIAIARKILSAIQSYNMKLTNIV